MSEPEVRVFATLHSLSAAAAEQAVAEIADDALARRLIQFGECVGLVQLHGLHSGHASPLGGSRRSASAGPMVPAAYG